jgi:hypothetical protein
MIVPANDTTIALPAKFFNIGLVAEMSHLEFEPAKALHGFKCQVCNDTIQLADGSLYAEAHHIQPLGRDHRGRDVIENILCVCPNHHAELDFGARRIAITDLAATDGHAVASRYVDYHNKTIYRGN